MPENGPASIIRRWNGSAVPVEFEGRRHKREVAEGLREVAELPAGMGIPFLTKQADVIAQFQ